MQHSRQTLEQQTRPAVAQVSQAPLVSLQTSQGSHWSSLVHGGRVVTVWQKLLGRQMLTAPISKQQVLQQSALMAHCPASAVHC
jgi:hypothetical protein